MVRMADTPDTLDTPGAPEPTDQPLVDTLDQIVRYAGGDPQRLDGKLAREIMHTATKLVRDGADTGQMKLISRSLKELRYALKVFRDYADVRKVAIFGSARTPDNHPASVTAEAFGRAMAAERWMVITGGGDGIMRAGHAGAGSAASFGVSIRLPFETIANEYIESDPKLIVFRYFFTRKLVFVSQAHALALFPGGFGTLDEAFETLTLIQTGKAPPIPIVMIETPGSHYWSSWYAYVRDQLLGGGLISAEDMQLFHIAPNVEDAVKHILKFYANYHSQRYVRDELVIRMLEPLAHHDIDELNDLFPDIIDHGRIEETEPLKDEQEHRDLPRLKFVFNRRNYGRLRQLIDRINQMALEERG